MAGDSIIRTPDQRLRVFVSSTLGELAAERAAVRAAIERLHLVPVMFELGARPHPPRDLYRAYLDQSHVFVGLYWQRYGWIAPGEHLSGLEDEYRAAGDRPRLLYIKEPAPQRDAELTRLLADVKADERASYKRFGSTEELAQLVERDLALLLSERFEASVIEAPPMVASPAARIPRPLDPLVGRDVHVDALTELISATARLVTITGPGGVGKSRLAIAVADRARDRFPGGVYLVPLATIDDPRLVMPTIARDLGIRLDGGRDAGAAISDELDGRHVLLVLDNLEQVVAAAPELAGLLSRCPGVTMLTTSRRALGLVGEHLWPLDPLPLPAPDADPTAMAESPAVELFVRRARAVDPAFTLEAAGAASVAELCRLLDGLPLAIELAAARARLLPPRNLVERVETGLDLLVGDGDRPERHRTLAATIDWSVQLLRPHEQELFARVSVFVGGATLDAVEAVAGSGDDGVRVLDALAVLLDHGLVVRAGGDDGSPRFDMLRTVHAVARTHLVERGELELMRRRHLEWFSALADEAQPYLCGPDQVRWLARIDPERDNVRAAVATGLELGEFATVLELAWDLYIFYLLRGAYQEPADWVRLVAQQPDDLDDREHAVITTATAIAALSVSEPDIPAVEHQLHDARSTFERVGATFELAVAWMHLGLCALERRDWQAAIAAEQRAITHFARVDHDWGVGSSQNLLGVALAASGDRSAAQEAHQQALDAGLRIDNAMISAQALTLLAEHRLDDGDIDAAVDHLVEAVSHVVNARDVTGASGCLEVIAAAALLLGDLAAASRALRVASEARHRIGSPLNVVLRDRVAALRSRIEARGGSTSWPAGGGAPTLDVFGALTDLILAVGERAQAAQQRGAQRA